MLVGYPPYYDRTRERIFENIRNAKLRMPGFMSDAAKSLIISLLQRDPSMRIDISDIKQHPYFADVDWDAILNKQIKPELPMQRQPSAARPLPKWS